MMKTLLTRAYCRGLSLAIVGLLFWAGQSSLLSAPVSLDAARAFAANWLAAAEKPMGAEMAETIQEVYPLPDPDGVLRAYAVQLAPEGYLVLSADDRIAPVIIVNSVGQYQPVLENPMHQMVLGELRSRLQEVEAAEQAATQGTRSGGRSDILADVTVNQNEWATFTGPATRTAAIMAPTEIWVDKLVKSRWSNAGGSMPYTYYLPAIYKYSWGWADGTGSDKPPPGCVAIGNAQIVRYYEWPQEAIGTHYGNFYAVFRSQGETPSSFGAAVDGVPLRGGDGMGGAYKWDKMPLAPSPNDSDEEQRQLGAFIFDCVVGAGATLNVNNLWQTIAGGAPYDIFQYSSVPAADPDAKLYDSYQGDLGIKYPTTGDGPILDSRAALDAGRPGTSGTSCLMWNPDGIPGHCILATGYGRMNGRWYTNLNFGFGDGGAWYNTSEKYLVSGGIWTGGAGGGSVIYRRALQARENAVNGSIISGRILDTAGNPVAGVKVWLDRWFEPGSPVPSHRDAAGNQVAAFIVPGPYTVRFDWEFQIGELVPAHYNAAGELVPEATATAVTNLRDCSFQPGQTVPAHEFPATYLYPAGDNQVPEFVVQEADAAGYWYPRWQSMLAWYDPIDPEKTPSRKAIPDPDPFGKDHLYRNTTNEKGIWAVDKIARGRYRICLEKDGLQFAGEDIAEVTGKKMTVWGFNFVASELPDLALENWWRDGDLVYLQFNRPIGDVDVDLRKVQLGDLIGDAWVATSLEGAIVHLAASSDLMILDVSGLEADGSLLSMQTGFLMVDFDGDPTQAGIGYDGVNNAPRVFVAPTVEQREANADNDAIPVSATVTGISRVDGQPFLVSGRTVEFAVTGSGLNAVTLRDFTYRLTNAYYGPEGDFPRKPGTELPTVTVAGWAAQSENDGVLTLRVGPGEGFLRADFFPQNGGTPFIQGETYYVDNQGPMIVKTVLSPDNRYVDITWNEPAGTMVPIGAIPGAAIDNVYSQNAPGDPDFTIWIEKPTIEPDYQFNANADALFKGEAPDEDTPSNGELGDFTVRVVYSGFDLGTLTVGKFMWVDLDENRVFTDADGIFLKVGDISWNQGGLPAYTPQPGETVEELKLGNTVYARVIFREEYDTARNLDAMMWLGPGAHPKVKPSPVFEEQETTVKATYLKGYQETLKKRVDNFEYTFGPHVRPVCYQGTPLGTPVVTSPSGSAMTEAFFSWWNSLDAVWLDYTPPSHNGFQVTTDTVLFGPRPAEDTPGNAFANTVYYIDLNGDGAPSIADFIWEDCDGSESFELVPDEDNPDRILNTALDASHLSWRQAITASELGVTLYANGGTVTQVAIGGITPMHVNHAIFRTGNLVEGGPSLVNASRFMRVWLNYTPQLSDYTAENAILPTTAPDGNQPINVERLTSYRVPAGIECIEIKPHGPATTFKIYDEVANVAPAETTTGLLKLHSGAQPRIVDITLSHDNYSAKVIFSRRIYPNRSGIMNFPQINYGKQAIQELMTPANFLITLLGSDGQPLQDPETGGPACLKLDSQHGIVYELGTAFVYLDFCSRSNAAENSALIRQAAKMKFEFIDIYDIDGVPLLAEPYIIDLWPHYIPGITSLMPPMFTNNGGEYDVRYVVVNLSGLYAFVNNNFVTPIPDEPPYTGYFYVRIGNDYFRLDRMGGYDHDGNEVAGGDYSRVIKVEVVNGNTVDSLVRGAYSRVWADSSYVVVAPDSSNPAVYQRDGILSFEQPCPDGVPYHQYGIWYRDLDGDGRVDAVDLNFHNPYYIHGSRLQAELQVGSSALSKFRIWVQVNDPEDLDNPHTQVNYFPADAELDATWAETFPNSLFGDYPLRERNGREIGDSKGGEIYDFITNFGSYTNFSRNWISVTVNDVSVVEQNLHWEGDSSTSYNRYSVLRVTFDQSRIPARTYGKRYVLVAYDGGRSKHDGGYDGQIVGGAQPLRRSGDSWVARPSSEVSDSDETRGLYWFIPRTSYGIDLTVRGNRGYTDTIFMVDSFGPVIAWDGAPPVPVTAVAWRTTPYPKTGEDDMGSYEYLDVTFSEPLAYATDTGMSNCGFIIRRENEDGFVAEGAWGAEIVSRVNPTSTVRYTCRENAMTTRDFTFSGTLYDMSPGFVNATSQNSTRPVATTAFSGTAIGIRPYDSRYQVLGPDDTCDVLAIDSSGAEITHGDYSCALTLNRALLKVFSQGGGFAANNMRFVVAGSTLTGNSSIVFTPTGAQSTSDLVFRAGLNTPAVGAGFLCGIQEVTVRNTRFNGYANANGRNFAVQSTYSVTAPETLGKKRGLASAATPANTVISGPVYIMAKVGTVTQTSATSRLRAGGPPTPVLGLDLASNANYTLGQVKVRVVDTSHGQFDPEIDLLPIADGANSGILLVDENAAGGPAVVPIASSGAEWSEWRINTEGLPYREIMLRPLAPVVLPTSGGAPHSFDFTIRVAPSAHFNLGDSFYVEIPDDGIFFGTIQSVDSFKAAWGTPNGTRGYAFTDYRYLDRNNDQRWTSGDPITSHEDTHNLMPLYDGGRAYRTDGQNTNLLWVQGQYARNLFYAKKNSAPNPETYPVTGYYGSDYERLVSPSELDFEFNVSYLPGDDIWYDVGGTFGVYDAGIDIPLTGNANAFILPWSIQEVGAKSAQFRGAAPSVAASVSDGIISAPTAAPAAVVGLRMQDSGRGFSPRLLLDGCIVVEAVSKNLAGGTYQNKLVYKGGAVKTLAWMGGAPVNVPAAVGGRVILEDADKCTFLVVRRFNAKALPEENINITINVSNDVDRNISQPVNITGVRVHSVGNAFAPGTSATLSATYGAAGAASLQWDGGPAVDVTAGGLFILPSQTPDCQILVEVSTVGGGVSDVLTSYVSDGRAITPLLNISGLEIVAVGDMIQQGFYTFSYDGISTLSWGTGAPKSIVPGIGSLTIVPGDADNHGFVVVRRTAARLPNAAVTDTVFINQTQLLRVDVSITNRNGVTSSHFAPMANDETSGLSLYWDADGDGVYSSGDIFVPLLEAPVLSGGASPWRATLVPDPDFIMAWLSCPAMVGADGHNFFVCVRTTEDMSYGDRFQVRATFYEPTEPNTTGYGVTTSASSGDITCTSVTNTVYEKLTSPGQTIDADTNVPLISIDHFLGAPVVHGAVYADAITFKIHSVSNFDPEQALLPLADEISSEQRGIVLVADTNNNGVFDYNDWVVPCTIGVDDLGDGVWSFTLRPVASNALNEVPVSDDNSPDLFIVLRTASTLRYGTALYATMGVRDILYSSGLGSAASALRTDTLTSTIASKYQDLLGSSMVTATTGLIVNEVGPQVTSAYHNVTFAYNPTNNQYTLSWNGISVIIDVNEVGTYTIGNEATGNYITVTFDPAAFFREDTLVCSPTGMPPQINDAEGRFVRPAINLGDKLTSLAGQAGLFYYDANVNGRYDHGETIAAMTETHGKKLVYGDAAQVALAVTPFSAADGLAFFSADGSGVFHLEYDAASDVITKYDAIFRDSDGVYTLPWMARTVDVDNYVTAGQGGAPGISTGANLVDATLASLPGNEALDDLVDDFATTSPLFLYYIDTVQDGLGYQYGEDIIIARQRAGAVTAPLAFAGATDKVVYDPAYVALEDKTEYVQPANGTALAQFREMDYMRYKEHADGSVNFAQGQALFLSYNATYKAPAFSWTIRVDKNRTVRRYNPKAMKPFDTARSAMTAVVGLDIANSGTEGVELTSLTVRFYNVLNFTTADLRPLANDETSGVQLWRDADGNGIFNPEIDQFVPLMAKPVWNNSVVGFYLTMTPAGLNAITGELTDGLYDFFVVVQPSITSNSSAKTDIGDQFQIVINNDDVVLNQTLNKVAAIATDVIVIDSRPPEQVDAAAIVDPDQDGYLERVVLTFHERLRPGMLADLDIWQLEDAATGAPVTVTNATLSDDYLTVTLTLAGNDLGSTSGPLRLKVAYADDGSAALLDWAGNPAEFRLDTTIPEADSVISNYVLSADAVVPRIVHTGVPHSAANYDVATATAATGIFFFRDRNDDGAWNPGENIWLGTATFDAACRKVWNGGSADVPAAWNTPEGYVGKPLAHAFFCDANDNDDWDANEFLWLDRSDPADPEAYGFYDPDVDVAVPLNRTEEIAVLDTDADGRLDALRVQFSEMMNDETIDGYKSDLDSFTANKWSLVGRGTLTAWRQGLGAAYADALNNNLLYFSFLPSTAPDTGAIPAMTVASGETFADQAGNRLNAGAVYASSSLVLNDQAPPVLLDVVSSNKVTKVAANNYALAAGTTLTLTFSEPVFQYLHLEEDADIADVTAGFCYTINDGADGWPALADKLPAGSTVEVDENTIVITFGAETEGWPQTGVQFRLAVNPLADSVFGDAVGHNPLPADFLVPSLDAPDPTRFDWPLAGDYIRDDNDGLAVKVHWGDNPADDGADWKLSIFAGHTYDPAAPLAEVEGDDWQKLTDPDADVDLADWAAPGQYAYTIVLTYLSGGVEQTVRAAFFYAAADDVEVFANFVNDGANPGEDADQVHYLAGKLAANWTDFAAANGRPAAAEYRYAFAVQGEEPAAYSALTPNRFGEVDMDLSDQEGVIYVAFVEAFDADGTLIARATSDGAQVVTELSDAQAPIIAFGYPKDGVELDADIDETTSLTSLGFNFRASDNQEADTGIAQYEYRLVRGAESALWSADNANKQLDFGRTGYAAVTVDNQAWIIGGYNGTQALATINYTPLNQDNVWASREWATLATGSLNTPRANFAFAKLGNGDLLAAGGSDGYHNYYASIELFSMATKTWRTLPVALPEPRVNAQAVVVDDNLVWIIGGRNNAGVLSSIVQIDLSDPATPVVTMLDSTLSVPRSYFQTALQTRADGKKVVLVIGGKTGSGGNTVVYPVIDVFSVETGARSTTELATGRFLSAVVSVPQAGSDANDVWVLGGFGAGLACLDSVECIRAANGAVIALSDMNSPRAEFAAAWLPDSETVIAVGGSSDAFGSVADSTEVAPSDGSRWDLATPLTKTTGLVGHSLAIAGVGDQARLVAFGGRDGTYQYLKATESRRVIEVALPWTAVAVEPPRAELAVSRNITGLALVDGATYTFQVRVTDAAGNTSVIASSDGVLVDSTLTRATITCAAIPAPVGNVPGQTAENVYSVTVGGNGVLSYKYRLTRDGAVISDWSAAWTPVGTKIELTLPDLGDYELSVIGRSDSREQLPGNATMASWTIVLPRAVVVAGLPVPGGKSYVTNPVVTIGGAGVRQYEYALDSFDDAAWSAPAPVETPITLTNLEPGDHTLYLRGYSFSNDQTRANRTVHAWTVLAQGLVLEFTPSLPPSMDVPVTAGTQFNVLVKDPANTDNPDADDIESYLYELWRDGQLIATGGTAATPIPQAEPIVLADLMEGDYLLKVKGYAILDDAWQDLFTEQAFTVATLGVSTFTPDLTMSTVDTYQVTVDLNGLTNYKYALLRQTADGDEIAIPETKVAVDDEADLTFTVGPLEAGVYILQLWGGDGVPADIYQPIPSETEIAVTQTTPVGPILGATLAAPAASAPVAAGNIDLELTFTAKLMALPSPADFIVSGVVVTAVNEVDDLNCTVTIAPDFPADANQVMATVQLAANKVYGFFTGNGNAASNTVSVLIYRDQVIALTLTAEGVDADDAPTGELLPAEGVDISDHFAVNVLIQAEDAFKGGDFILKFDADKFRLVGPLQEDGEPDAQGNIPVDGAAAIADDFNQLEVTIADYVYDNGKIVGLRLAGAAAPGVDIRTPTLYATLVFQAIGAADGADSDFFTEAGQSGLLLNSYGLVGPAGDAVAFGACQVPVTFVANGLAIAFDPASVNEGGVSTMTLTLDYALDYDLVVTINDEDYTVPAGETSASFADIPAEADDQLLTGDRKTVFTATAVNDDSHVTSLEGVSATLIALDDEAEGITFTITDPDSGDEIDSIPEDGKFRLTAALSAGVTAAADAKFALAFGGTAAAGTDYAISGNLVIANGANAGSIDITSYPDGVVDTGKTITVQVTGLTIGAAGAAANFVAPAVMTVQVENIDGVAGDIAVDKDGKSDGVVDIDDLLFFLNHWMAVKDDPETGHNYDASCDFNADGIIDLDDLLILLNNWTEDGTRSGAPAVRGDNVLANVTVRLQEKDGKTSVALNDTVTIQAFVSTDWQGGLSGGRVDVNYTPGVLSFHGDFNHKEVVKNFTLQTQGTLYDADGLIEKIGGANLGGLGYNTEVLFLEFTLDAATLGEGTATVSIGDDFNFSTLSGGPKTADGTLGVIVANSLTFTVTDPTVPPQPEFALAFEREYTAGTRASAKAELILGMLQGASFDIIDPEDRPAGSAFPGVYYVAFDEPGRNAQLKWDFRDLSDEETWHVIGRLPAGSSLKLDWSLSLAGTDPDYSMPDYFDFFIVFPTGARIDMRSAANKYIEFTNEGTADMDFEFAVEVVKHIDLLSHTYELHGGWNLIGVPFELDNDSYALLAALDSMGYDPATAAYVMDVNQFVPGKAYWVYVHANLLTAGVYNMTLRGTEVADPAVPVSAGWNLVSPLYRSDLVNAGNPTSATIPTVWYWAPDGYLWLLPEENAEIGVGYWLKSLVDGEIWPQVAPAP